jgi:hypothetical protein
MACGCRQLKPDLEVNPRIVYGEKGLDLIMCVANIPYSRIGDFTGYTYPFNMQKSMYIDTRDTVYIIGSDFRLEN